MFANNAWTQPPSTLLAVHVVLISIASLKLQSSAVWIRDKKNLFSSQDPMLYALHLSSSCGMGKRWAKVESFTFPTWTTSGNFSSEYFYLYSCIVHTSAYKTGIFNSMFKTWTYLDRIQPSSKEVCLHVIRHLLFCHLYGQVKNLPKSGSSNKDPLLANLK